MRLIGGAHGNSRLGLPMTYKVKGQTAVSLVGDDNNATTTWTTWPWATRIKPQLDAAIAMGANTFSLKGDPDGVLNSGAVTHGQVAGQYRQFVEYAAANNCKVYASLGIGTNTASSVAGYAANIAFTASVCDPYPNVIGLDMWNEINIFNTPSAPNLIPYVQACRAAVKAVTTIPVTVSVGGNLANTPAVNYLAALSPYVDFLDFHPYADTAVPIDLSTFRALPWWKNFIIGEVGVNQSITSAQQTALIQHFGLYSNEPDCYGVVAFCMADYDTSSPGGRYGCYDETMSNPRSAIITPFTAWRSVP